MKHLYSLLYILVFMGIGVLTTLIGQYLEHAGFSGEQIGVITAAGTLTAIFAVPFWGRRYSLVRDGRWRYSLVALVLACAALTSLVICRVSLFGAFLALFVVLYFFQSPTTSLMDAMTIDDGQRFGGIRTFGAAGFAVASFGAAFAADAFGIGLIFPIYTACFAAGMIAVLLLARKRGENPAPAEDVDSADIEIPADAKAAAEDTPAGPIKNGPGRSAMLRELTANRPYVLLLLCAFFINGTDVANNTYFSFLYLEGGGTLAGVGIAFFLMAGSEAPFMAASDWLCDRFGQGRVLLVAMVFSIVRFGLFALGLPSPVLIALFPLQGLVNGITLVEFVKFTARLIPQRLHGFGIAVYYAVGSSCSTILCQLIGGRLLESGLLSLSGPQSVYLFFAVFNIAGVLIFLAAKFHRV